MQLNIKDRIYIPQLLLQQNNFLDYTLKKSIVNKVKITKEDRATYSIEEDAKAGKVTWNHETDMQFPLDVDFTQQELDYLKRSCEALADSVYPDDLWLTVEKIYNAL